VSSHLAARRGEASEARFEGGNRLSARIASRYAGRARVLSCAETHDWRAAYECASRPRWLARGRCSSVLPELRHAEPGYGADVLQVQLQREGSSAAQVQGHDVDDEPAADSGARRAAGPRGSAARCTPGSRSAAGWEPRVRSSSSKWDRRRADRWREQVEGDDGRRGPHGGRLRWPGRSVSAARCRSGSIGPSSGGGPSHPAASRSGATRRIRLLTARAPGRGEPARRDDGRRREPLPVCSPTGRARAVRGSPGPSTNAGDAGHGRRQSPIPVRCPSARPAAAAGIWSSAWRLRRSTCGSRRLWRSAPGPWRLWRSARATRIHAGSAGGV
jgi:hypothetical protein